MLSYDEEKMLGLDSIGKVVLFVFYIGLWTNQGILVHLSVKWDLKYNVTSAVFCQDLCKLIITLCLYSIQEGSMSKLVSTVKKNQQLFMMYMVPAGMYAIYNNLTFYALSRFEPASYFVLMQFKIVMTAALSVSLLNKKVEKLQWIGLVVIMIGSMLKEMSAISGKSMFGNRGVGDYGIILVQLLLSAFAGVYTEKLLKGKSDASPNVQNFFMYVDGMIVNSLVLMLRAMFGNTTDANKPQISTFNNSLHPLVIAIVLNASFTGVVTAFFLKVLGSIMKSIAAALELWTTAIASWIIFSYEIDSSAAIAIGLVSAGIWLYSEGGKTAAYAPVPAVPSNRDLESSDCDVELKAK
jgi:UDP-galactose transporter